MESTEVVATATEESTPHHEGVTRPIVIDLGKQRGKRIKRLKRGKGKLWDEVLDVTDEVGRQLTGEVDDKVLVPIVMIYRKKQKKGMRGNPFFPFAQ